MKIRRRFTISSELLAEAEQYAEGTNRKFSDLVCEALQQMMSRYPRLPRRNTVGKDGFERFITSKIAGLEEHFGELSSQVSDLYSKIGELAGRLAETPGSRPK
jgi:exonuclease V gamma subunit